ncbi:MAG: hypothetical protein QW051_00145 [Candidatus Aenigmatarchaeota archaeon]
MKKNLIILTSLILTIFLSLPFGSAYSNIGLSVSKDKVSGCPGYAIPIDLTISNNDDITHTYSLSLELPVGWKIPDNGFIKPEITLASGESKTITFWINPPIVSPNAYYVKVKAKVGVEEEIKTIQVEVLRCHDVAVLNKDEITMCKDTEFQYIFSLLNNGKGAEEFDVVVSTSWSGEVYNERVLIKAGEKREVVVDVVSPMDDGKITVKAISTTSYAKSEKTTELNIQNCYDFDVFIEPREARSCIGEQTKFILTIKNKGTSNDLYKIILPSGWTVSEENISVKSGEEKKIQIITYLSVKGKANFEFTVTSKNYPKIEKTLGVSIETIECKGVAVIVSPNSQEICQGVESKFKVTVKNTGTTADKYEIYSNLGKLEKEILELNAGDISEFYLVVDTAKIEPKEHSIVIIAKTGDISDKNEAKLLVRNCYSVELAVTPESKDLCFGDEIVYILALKNTGEFPDNYTLWLNENVIGNASLSPNEFGMYSTKMKIDLNEGEHKLVFKALSENAKAEAVAIVKIKSKSECYNVEISSDESKLVVEPGEGYVIEIKVKNVGEKDDLYSIEINGPEWIYATEKNLNIPSGKEDKFYVYISPGFDVKRDVYDASVVLKSENVQKEVNLKIGVGMEPEMESEEKPSITIPTGGITALSPTSIKVIILALIVLIIIIILAVKFVLFLK